MNDEFSSRKPTTPYSMAKNMKLLLLLLLLTVQKDLYTEGGMIRSCLNEELNNTTIVQTLHSTIDTEAKEEASVRKKEPT